jgi:hydrogenase-1 operon protein HyaF
MDTYQRPETPEPEAVRHLTGAREAMDWLQASLDHYRVGGPACLADITQLDRSNRELVNQILGEGDVSLKYIGTWRANAQEAVLVGVWRILYLDSRGQISRDLIEVAEVPFLARPQDEEASIAADDLTADEAPAEVMNAMPILTELQEHQAGYASGQAAHVINLTLLPLSEADTTYLDQILGTGPVEILSRGYGDCQMISTAVPGIWWVRYRNSMGKLILNTLEVVDVPAVARAAQEDIDDSALRLKEILESYWSD